MNNKNNKVAIIGIGRSNFNSVTPDLSYRELVYTATVKAYEDANISHEDVESFVCCQEDWHEGTSAAVAYTPEQLGAVLRPVHTITGDGLHGLITGYMQILSNMIDIVVVEAHSKASNIQAKEEVAKFALDPIYIRPFDCDPYFIAGLEAHRYLYEGYATREQFAKVVIKNKSNALYNDAAVYPAKLTIEEVLNSKVLFYPLTELDISKDCDGAIVIVLASEKMVKKLNCRKPIWIKGVGWCSSSPDLATRDWIKVENTSLAAEQAYKQAGITEPTQQIDFAEIDDTISYKELQHIEALKLANEGEASKLLEAGRFDRDGPLPVNTSGGSLGVGNLYEANGLYKVYEIVTQLRDEAGKRQLTGIEVGLAHSSHGIFTTSSAVVILER